MFTLVEIGMIATAFVFLVLGLVALVRCDRAAIPETVRALSSWLGHRPLIPPLVEHPRSQPAGDEGAQLPSPAPPRAASSS